MSFKKLHKKKIRIHHSFMIKIFATHHKKEEIGKSAKGTIIKKQKKKFQKLVVE